MTSRQVRRPAERQENKLARKTARPSPASPVPAPSAPTPVDRAAVNRANAQSSTGPRSPEGKTASSRNSFKHGLYSKQLVLPGEDPAELDELRRDLRAEHQPAGPTEEILVNELAEQFWRMRRMRRLETRAWQPENLAAWSQSGILARIERTAASAERAFHKALAALSKLQSARIRHAPAPRSEQPAASASAEVGLVPPIHAAAVESGKLGFVPSLSQDRLQLPREETLDSDEAGLFAPRAA